MASLYAFDAKNNNGFFYVVNDSPIEQLIYKRYKVGTDIRTNNAFKSQLWDKVNCGNLPKSSFDYVGYFEPDLLKLFKKYNECTNSNFVTFAVKKKRDAFDLSLRPGVNLSTFKMYNAASSFGRADFGEAVHYRLGLELAYFLSFNKNKWSVFIEPTYQYYESSKQLNLFQDATINYQSIEVPLGVRHHFYLGDHSSITVHDGTS